MALTAKQKLFVQEYLVDLNATAAAIRAGYSEKTANRIASENLTKPDIHAAIQEAMQAREKRTEITQDYVIQKLREIAEKEASDANDSELRYVNKLRAIELLGKHVGAFEKKENQGDADSVRIIIDV